MYYFAVSALTKLFFKLNLKIVLSVKKLFTVCAQLLNKRTKKKVTFPLFLATMQHLSVLQKDVQNYLNLNQGDTVLDATLGLGGHSLDILKKIGKSGRLYAFEQDERNLNEAQKRLKDYQGQITYIHDNFRYLKSRVTGKEFDGILFDLGLSSPHIDDSSRGFSFMKDGPLDMRFDPRSPLTAEIVLNTYPERELARIFREYGEEKFSNKVARYICEDRKTKKFTSTAELAAMLKRIIPESKKSSAHPATRVFQALRIEVNDELNALKEALNQSFEVLNHGGRLVVISYHSLEDRITKQFFRELEKPEADAEKSIYSVHGDPLIKILTKKPVTPTEEEMSENPRSRSAKLRALQKI